MFLAAFQRSAQHALHVPEFPHSLSHMGQTLFDEYLHFSAGSGFEEFDDVFLCKSGRLCGADEEQPLQVAIRIQTVVGRCARARAEQIRPLVVSNGRGGDVRGLRKLSDRQCFRHRSILDNFTAEFNVRYPTRDRRR